MTHALIAALLLGLTATAHAAPFDPREHRSPLAGDPTQVMVLGSPHISGLPKSFEPEHLAPLLDRLAGWKPDAIAIEALSGLQCDMLMRNAGQFPGVADNYCIKSDAAVRAIGMDTPAATVEADRLLAELGPAPSPAQRRRLALTFLAAQERASALVQWLRLPAGERKAADGLTTELVELLDGLVTRRNENYLVAAALAARLGHQRVWPMDDHSSDRLTAGNDPQFENAMREIWGSPELKIRLKANQKLEEALGTPEGTMQMYFSYNLPAEANIAFETDFGAAMRHESPGFQGRRYLGWWETRNLRMAANIREVAARKPGQRVLVLSGASHKGYLDAYLGMMHDLKIVDPLPLLK